MKNSKDQLQQLLSKPEWTHEEKQWLLSYLDDSESDELKALLQAQFEQDLAVDKKDQGGVEKALAVLHQRIGRGKKQGLWMDGKQKFLRGLAAAAAVGLLAIGTYVFFQPAPLQETTSQRGLNNGKKNDVLPGGNKAVLTLGDGSTIVLSDKENGELAEQGKTKLFKLNGQLTYRVAGSASGKVFYNTISTPRGGQYQVVLADGSSVWLNAESSLHFPTAFARKERRVEIKGEAYFEVVKNKAQPFVASVNGAEVRVLGTHFNVKAYENETVLKTTLLEGAVKFTAGKNSVLLKPGQQSQRTATGAVDVLSDVDLEKELAWKNGYFDFDGESLEAVAKQLSRWYDVEVTGTNKIADLFYAEIPRNTKLSDVLHALELTGKVHFQIEGKKVIVKQ